MADEEVLSQKQQFNNSPWAKIALGEPQSITKKLQQPRGAQKLKMVHRKVQEALYLRVKCYSNPEASTVQCQEEFCRLQLPMGKKESREAPEALTTTMDLHSLLY